jgi:hypothetical protein
MNSSSFLVVLLLVGGARRILLFSSPALAPEPVVTQLRLASVVPQAILRGCAVGWTPERIASWGEKPCGSGSAGFAGRDRRLWTARGVSASSPIDRPTTTRRRQCDSTEVALRSPPRLGQRECKRHRSSVQTRSPRAGMQRACGDRGVSTTAHSRPDIRAPAPVGPAPSACRQAPFPVAVPGSARRSGTRHGRRLLRPWRRAIGRPHESFASSRRTSWRNLRLYFVRWSRIQIVPRSVSRGRRARAGWNAPTLWSRSIMRRRRHARKASG